MIIRYENRVHVDPHVPSVKIAMFSAANTAGGGFDRFPVPVVLLQVFGEYGFSQVGTAIWTYKSDAVSFSGVDWYDVKESPISGTAAVIWLPLV